MQYVFRHILRGRSRIPGIICLRYRFRDNGRNNDGCDLIHIVYNVSQKIHFYVVERRHLIGIVR